MFQRKTFTLFIVSVCATFLLAFFIYQELTLLSFINTSFFIAGFFIFLSLLTITVKGGFFDGITYGFRRMFVSKGKQLSKQEIHEMTPVSELLNLDHPPILINGLFMLGIMLIALIIYYL